MKTLFLSIYIARRFNRSTKKNKIISLNTVIAIIGTSLGISILIICLSAIHGFTNELNTKILSIIPHGDIRPINSCFHNWKNILQNIKQIPGIIHVSPYINCSGFIIKNNKLHLIQINGIDTTNNIYCNTPISSMNNKIFQLFQANKKQIIIGKGVADTLEIKKNDWINVIIHNPNKNNTSLIHNKIYLQVFEILNLHSYLDHNIALIPLPDAQNYLSKQTNVSGFNIKVNNILHISQLIYQAGKATNHHVSIQSWIDIYNDMYKDIQTMRAIIYFTMTLIISIALFNIISTLIISIKEKTHDIAILRTLGANKYLICTIFMWHNLINNSISLVIGSIFGIFISLNLTHIYNTLENILGYKLISHDIYFINFLPTDLHIKDIIIICSIEFIISIISTLYPAIRANQIKPAKILK